MSFRQSLVAFLCVAMLSSAQAQEKYRVYIGHLHRRSEQGYLPMRNEPR